MTAGACQGGKIKQKAQPLYKWQLSTVIRLPIQASQRLQKPSTPPAQYN